MDGLPTLLVWTAVLQAQVHLQNVVLHYSYRITPLNTPIAPPP